MKFSNLILAASIVAMTFASCNKEDEAGTGDNSLKSVTISLANVLPGTRSAIPDGEGDLSETEINLINYQVFFSDGTNLYRGKKPTTRRLTHRISLWSGAMWAWNNLSISCLQV